MSENGTSAQQGIPAEGKLIHRVTVVGWFLTALFALACWPLLGSVFSRSLLLGGLLANGSFWLLKFDIRRLMQRVSGNAGQAVAGVEKIRFFIQFFARILILGLLLFVMAARMAVDVVGLCLGLGTVMLSVVLIGLGQRLLERPKKV